MPNTVRVSPLPTLIRLVVAIAVVLAVALSTSLGPARAQQQSDETAIPDRFSVKIGVLAFRGTDRAVSRWTPTAQYLAQMVPDYDFEIVPLTLEEMEKAAQDGTVDFVLTNSGNYVILESRYGVSRIATLRTPVTVEAGNVFGAVIFTRAEHPDIHRLEDLKGHSFIAVNEAGFGGFQMAWRELKAHGIDPFDDFSRLTFSGFPQDVVVNAVSTGQVDAGTIRTGTLENLASEGRINLANFRVLNPKSFAGFPYELSTELYPEWPFARMPDTSEEMSQRVAIALMSMPHDHPAAKAGRYGGWAVASDYKPVYDLFHDLRIGPYAELGNITFGDVLRKHWEWFVFALVLLVVVVGWAAHTEQVVAERTRDLTNANKELERQIAERRKAEEETRKRDNEIAHVWRFSTMGEMATNLAHELNQPLSAITNYAQGCARRLRAGRTDSEPLLDAMVAIAAQADRANQIIRRIRAFLKKDEPHRIPLDVAKATRDVIGLLSPEIAASRTRVETDFTAGLPSVDADPVQVQQVVLNLMRNGIEAMNAIAPESRVLRVSTAAQAGGWVEIGVADAGTGIPEDHLDQIFDPFYTTKTNGLGMGLTISRSIIESHGGRLSASPNPGGGTRFRILLPVSQEKTIHAA